MSIIGKGYFINSDNAVIHIVAPRDSTITLNHSDSYDGEIDKTIIKTSGWPRSGREWVQDYYIRIPERLFGYWKFSGSKSGNILHCKNESISSFPGTQDEISLEVSEKKEYLYSCYLNAPILEYDDLVYITTNDNYSASINHSNIIINNDINNNIVLTGTSNNNQVQIKYNNKYIVSINSVDDITTLSGKTHISFWDTDSNYSVKLIQDGPEEYPLIGEKLYGITNQSGVSVIDPLTSRAWTIPKDTLVEIYTIEYYNNTDFYRIYVEFEGRQIDGLVSMRAINLINGTIRSISFQTTDLTLGGEGPVYFYGSYQAGSGIRDYPSYNYPVRRLSDGAIGILRRYWQYYSEPSVEYREILSFSAGEYSAPSGETGIRTTRETWIES